MITFCIDPGMKRNCGLAAIHESRLVSAALIDARYSREAVVFAQDVLHGVGGIELCGVVLEVPRVYPGQRAKADPNDLIALAVAGARVAQAIVEGAHAAHTLYIAPSDWKAQTDPDIMCERVLAKLDDSERAVIEKVFAAHGKKGMPKSLRHNVIDAVGMGLWRVGRMRPGGAGR